jgi:signal peptidase
MSIYISYLAYLGGYWPAVVYHVVLLAFEWFFPILPNLNWPMKTFLGCFIPAFSLIFVQQFYLLKAKLIKRNSAGGEEILGWFITSIASVAIIWFSVGLFPLYPSVIITGSMEPVIKPGDIVLVKKSGGGDVRVGDIIQYYDKDDKIYITHRIIALNNGKEKTLMTKGDNNNTPDFSPVSLSQVKGKIVSVIPKAGLLTLYLRSGGETPEAIENTKYTGRR